MLDANRIMNRVFADRCKGGLFNWFTTPIYIGDRLRLDTSRYSIEDYEKYLVVSDYFYFWHAYKTTGELYVSKVNALWKHGKWWTEVRSRGIKAYMLDYELRCFIKVKGD